jgi:hypothetical protein
MAKWKKNDLSLEQARELFRYENGRLFWNSKIRSAPYSIGDRVGTRCRIIPTVIVNGQVYQMHRIVYLLHHGFCPEKIDFKNKDLTSEGVYDISIENLYEPPKKEIIKKPKKKYIEDLSYIEANTYLEYKNGRLYWKEKPTPYGGIVVGQLAGGRHGSPYLRLMLYKKSYMQHRIVYLLHHRHCPEFITFIDKTLTDEGLYDISIENLKETTLSHSLSVGNYKNGKTSKYRGVYFKKQENKYSVRISVNRVRKQYGLFENEEEAARKYDEMAKILIGEDARLNFPEEKPLSISSP